MEERMTRDEMFLHICQALASRGTCWHARVGCAIVKGSRVISTGYCGAPPGMPHCFDEGCIEDAQGHCIRTIHAEANAIAWAARYGQSVEGATLYTTLAPCYRCAQLILAAGIVRVASGVLYHEKEGVELLLKGGVEVEVISLG